MSKNMVRIVATFTLKAVALSKIDPKATTLKIDETWHFEDSQCFNIFIIAK
jgi:hypothetical protein